MGYTEPGEPPEDDEMCYTESGEPPEDGSSSKSLLYVTFRHKRSFK